MDISIDDSTSLPDRLDLLNVQEVDPVIGLGDSDESQPSPHFASPKRHDVATVSRSTTTPPAPGETAPPHIAGVRGERDGFDSRGLPIPDYPSESQRRGEQGLVIVDVEVLPDGRVGSVHVASDAGYPRLGYAAAQKIKLATFEPAKVNGRPVVGHIRIPYRFTLQ
jgi:protein TonB